RMFTSWRAEHPGGPGVLAETSGKNALIVTPSADYDLAVADAVRSAFGHAGQKCSAASLLILVGSVATSERFRRQLLDSVASLRVAPSAADGLAVAGAVRPAFGRAGQKCAAASLLILVGSVAASERFRRQLIDSVASLRVGWPDDLSVTMGPVVEPPQGKLRDA